MLGRFCHERWARLTRGLAVSLLVLCCILSAGAHAQSSPSPKPSGSVNIHQVQVAFIGSGAVGGGTLYFRGRRINNSEPDWEATLEGRPKAAYEFWHDHLRPLGFHLKAEVLEYPGGMPGDIGFFLTWK